MYFALLSAVLTPLISVFARPKKNIHVRAHRVRIVVQRQSGFARLNWSVLSLKL